MDEDSRAQLMNLLRTFPNLRDADLSAGFELDSVDLLQLVIHLEESLGIDLDALHVEPDELRTVDGILNILARAGRTAA